MESQTLRIDSWTWARRGEGEVDGKSNGDTYVTMCKIDSQRDLLCGSGNSDRGSVSA